MHILKRKREIEANFSNEDNIKLSESKRARHEVVNRINVCGRRIKFSRHLQLSQLNLLPDNYSQKMKKIKLPTRKSEYISVYANQRDYSVAKFVIIEKSKFTLVESEKVTFVKGSGSIVSFYKNIKGKEIALKTSKFYKRQYEYEHSVLDFTENFGKINQRWVDEWKVHAFLKSKYPNKETSPVVTVYGGLLYRVNASFQISVAMERVEFTLEEIIRNRNMSVEIILKSAVSLRDIHVAGVVYSDFKPSNLLVHLKKRIEVTFSDFDCSAILTEKHFFQSNGGTKRYFSPERERSQVSTYNDDVWAFGVVLLEALKGHKIYNAVELVERNMLEEYLEVECKETQEFCEVEVDFLKELISNILCKNVLERPTLDDIIELLNCVVQT